MHKLHKFLMGRWTCSWIAGSQKTRCKDHLNFWWVSCIHFVISNINDIKVTSFHLLCIRRPMRPSISHDAWWTAVAGCEGLRWVQTLHITASCANDVCSLKTSCSFYEIWRLNGGTRGGEGKNPWQCCGSRSNSVGAVSGFGVWVNTLVSFLLLITFMSQIEHFTSTSGLSTASLWVPQKGSLFV